MPKLSISGSVALKDMCWQCSNLICHSLNVNIGTFVCIEQVSLRIISHSKNTTSNSSESRKAALKSQPRLWNHVSEVSSHILAGGTTIYQYRFQGWYDIGELFITPHLTLYSSRIWNSWRIGRIWCKIWVISPRSISRLATFNIGMVECWVVISSL